MSELTFEQKLVQEWERFCEYSNNKDKTDAEVIAQEATTDGTIHDLMVDLYDVHPEYFSHPPVPPNRRRP